MSRVIVIGAGLAGLVAANRLADGGAEVLLLSKGIGGLQLGQGTVDVLGYNPQRVTNPIKAVAEVAAEHPYATIGAQGVLTALGYLKELVPDLLVGDPEANYHLPTAVGALRPTCLAQPSMLAGNLKAGSSVVVVGLRRLKDFQPELIAGNLGRTELPDGGRVAARAINVDIAAREGEIDSSGLAFAHAFDVPAFRQQFADLLAPLLKDGEIVALPAVIGLKDRQAHSDLAAKLGHPVFEIPLPPPSVAGLRLNQALNARALAAGVRMVSGVRTVGFAADGDRILNVRNATVPAEREYRADAFVLATGGFEAGALAMDSYGTVTETLFGLPLVGTENTPLIHGDYWGAEQPIFSVGVGVDSQMRVLGNGKPVYANLRAVGDVIAGSTRWAEKSGDGVAAASAVLAADSILKEL
ncbi:glycerol 3-phosphate dehydrogenase (quinone) subunit B [Propionicimonas paludicola]|uniref:Glycerol 3-phosphate dehydrogenase (Quinone) subunit B n=1 Tax=Propionicimonas paludicola TaxID=185243 RepID=A0A2A9CX53_9ACTN|nr:glycerol-3-phosphate dehydrogenase subunit GlpB [Propionicimonas paludicola]PFG18210.1 glycerol 3-phosphate dehydrogenase (quinone) subunit B [Propionicimonas paludicola]